MDLIVRVKEIKGTCSVYIDHKSSDIGYLLLDHHPCEIQIDCGILRRED
jgi:hypothetical protein